MQLAKHSFILCIVSRTAELNVVAGRRDIVETADRGKVDLVKLKISQKSPRVGKGHNFGTQVVSKLEETESEGSEAV
jgi:hypothetical protein